MALNKYLILCLVLVQRSFEYYYNCVGGGGGGGLQLNVDVWVILGSH